MIADTKQTMVKDDLTDSEKKLIVEVFSNIKLTGNVFELPEKLAEVASIINKLSS